MPESDSVPATSSAVTPELAAPVEPAGDAPADPAAAADAETPVATDEQDIPNYGTTPGVPGDANPNVASVVEALANPAAHPERLSPMHAPAPFNAEAYLSNPQAYLDVVEPGRVFQAAQPGEAPRLRPAVAERQRVVQGEQVALSVKGVPSGMPVTFTSFDLGVFAENRLTSVTVPADDRGLATVHLEGTPGTIADVGILAASPATSGHIRFIVEVVLPGDPEQGG
ncbi:MAG: hypothetical protein PF961_23760 [Planctomycetota bacterium]|jgi:hypothetical protein|nr:hypothetical protein [Planctomycetota bacterium]